MEKLDLLAVALGLACLAGINLYLTVFASGLAIHFHWITLAPPYQSLEVLGDPVIVTIAGILLSSFGLYDSFGIRHSEFVIRSRLQLARDNRAPMPIISPWKNWICLPSPWALLASPVSIFT